MNGASDQTAATVVSSLMTNMLEGVMSPHAPSRPISPSAVLFVPAGSPGLPPVITRYTGAEADGHVYAPAKLNCPFVSEVTVRLNSDAAVAPYPLVLGV